MPDLQVIQFDPNTGLGTVTLGNTPKKLTGIDLLAQAVALSYLRNPGQDVIAPNEGSGVRADIGQTNITSSDQASLLLMQRTKTVETEVITRQLASDDPSEKLKSLTVISVAADIETASVAAVVKVVNEAGESTTILV